VVSPGAGDGHGSSAMHVCGGEGRDTAVSDPARGKANLMAGESGAIPHDLSRRVPVPPPPPPPLALPRQTGRVLDTGSVNGEQNSR